MEFRFDRTSNATADLAVAADPLLRLCTVPRTVTDTPQTWVKAEWQESSPLTAGHFSGVAYFFGRKLTAELGVPVGLIHSSWGGTAAESWIPRDVLEQDSAFRPIMDRWNEAVKTYPEAQATYLKNLPALLEKWRQDSVNAVAKGFAPPSRPPLPRGPGSRDTPSGQWNGMMEPLIPLAIRGVIWYQGESNATRAEQYRTLFPSLINTWRKRWDAEFPFYYVQLPNLRRQPEPSRSGWAELRESQLMTLSVPNTGMVVTVDVGDSLDLHPTNKRPVGERLAMLALSRTYGRKDIAASGPIYVKSRVEGKTIRVSFTEIGKELRSKSGKELTGFVIAGPDSIFTPARAKIEDGEVVVWSEKIQKPIAVRYAWADNPIPSLYNDAGLPASPFRTDDWPAVTTGRR